MELPISLPEFYGDTKLTQDEFAEFITTKLGVQWVAEVLTAVEAKLRRPPTLQELNAALLARFQVRPTILLNRGNFASHCTRI